MRNRNMKIFMAIGAIVIIAAAGVFFYSISRGAPSGQFDSDYPAASGETAHQANNYIKKMDEPLSVISTGATVPGVDFPDSDKVYAMWEGELKFTVLGATLYSSPEAANINSADLFKAPSHEGGMFLEIKLRIENVSAEALDDGSGDGTDSSSTFSPECFNVKMAEVAHMSNLENTTEISEVEFLGDTTYFADSGECDSYFSFILPKGKQLDTTIGYWVSDTVLDYGDLAIWFAGSKNSHFAVRLDKLTTK